MTRFLCRIGLHRWRFRSEHHAHQLWTWARCERGCRRYSDWIVVDVEQRHDRR